jgi:hypothetical protein
MEWNGMISSLSLQRSMLLGPQSLPKIDFPQVDPPRPAVGFCPAYGQPYRLADYRADADRIYCSACRKELPK